MAVTEPTRISGPFVGDGVLDELDFDFETMAVGDISVGVTNADGIETFLTLNTHYTVLLNSGSAGGTVNLLTALATGLTARVYGDAMPYTRTGNIISNPGGFFPGIVNAAFDRVHIALLQLAAKVSRSLLLPVDPATVVGMYPVVLPDGTTGWSSGTGADAGLRADLAVSAGSGLVRFSHSEVYVSGTIGRRFKQEVWVTDAPFNADPTGVADAAPAIQSAINFAAAQGISTVRLNGIFRTLSTITMPTGVSLEGLGARYRFSDGNIFEGTWIKYRGSAANPAIRFGSVQSCRLSHLGIDCNEVATTRAISIGSNNAPATKGLVFHDLLIFGATTGVQWGDSSVTPQEQCDEITFRDSQFHSCTNGFIVDAANAADFSVIERISFNQLSGIGFKLLTPGFMRIAQCAAGLLSAESKMFEISGASPDPLIIEGCQSEGPNGKFLTYTSVNDQGNVILNGNAINQPMEINGTTRVISRGNFFNSTVTTTGFVRWKSHDDVFDGVFNQPTYAQQVFLGEGAQFSAYSLKNGTSQRGFHLPNNYHIENGSATAGGFTGVVNTREGIYAYPYAELASASFPVGFTVIPTADNAHAYIVTANVGAIGAEPAWPTGAGATVTSGGVTFQEIGTAALMKGYGAIAE